MERFLQVVIVVGMSALFAAPAMAQQTQLGVEEPDDAERAQRYFDQGAQLYYESQYSAAIVEFRKAHQAHPHPLFLYNIAVASRNLGRHRDAIDAAQAAEAMDEELPPELSARTRAIVVGSSVVMRAQQRVQEMEPGQPPGEQQIVEESVPEVEFTPAVEDSGFGLWGWLGAAQLGLGAVALGSAAMMDRSVRNRWDDVETALGAMDDATFDDRLAAIEQRQTMGKFFLFSGAGLVAVGGTLLAVEIISGSGDESVGVAVAPILHRSGLELRVTW